MAGRLILVVELDMLSATALGPDALAQKLSGGPSAQMTGSGLEIFETGRRTTAATARKPAHK